MGACQYSFMMHCRPRSLTDEHLEILHHARQGMIIGTPDQRPIMDQMERMGLIEFVMEADTAIGLLRRYYLTEAGLAAGI
jgi:hypothetical protein